MDSQPDEQPRQALHEETVHHEQEVQSDRPAWLPEGISTGEELAEKYRSLEKAWHGRQTDEAPTVDTQPELAPPPIPKADFQRYKQEWAQHGQLTEQSFSELEAIGLSREVVGEYISNQSARSELAVFRAAQEIGGTAVLADVLDFSKSALEPAEAVVYQDRINSAGLDVSKLASVLKDLKALYIVEHGIQPQLVRGGGSGDEAHAFKSMKELADATRDPRYKQSAEFRADVERRLKFSSI